MFPLDSEKSLEIFEGDRGLVRVESVSEEFAFEVNTLLREQIKIDLVVLVGSSKLVELLLPFPTDLGVGAVGTAQPEGGCVVGALLSGLFNMGTLMFHLLVVFFDDVMLFSIDTSHQGYHAGG